MSTPDFPLPEHVTIDERWMPEWLAFGFDELVAYLTKWARFSELYPEEEPDGKHDHDRTGDCA